MSEQAIQISGVAKAFGGKAVLKKVDLGVPTGSVTGLLGKNGAGKTTLIKCLLGLLKCNSGQSVLLGQSAWSMDTSVKARLGYVPQSAGLYPWLKIHQLVAYTAAYYPRWNQKLVDDLLSQWELSPSQRIGSLSIGTQQKLAIILALGHEPDLLVLDEPAASLDPSARREFLKAILAVASEGTRTVLFSTHITSDLERVADRVAVLKDGVIEYSGDLDALKDSMKRWHITAAGPLPADLGTAGAVPGVVRASVHGSEAILTVRDATRGALRAAENRFGANIEVEDLSLEDIFLEMHHHAGVE